MRTMIRRGTWLLLLLAVPFTEMCRAEADRVSVLQMLTDKKSKEIENTFSTEPPKSAICSVDSRATLAVLWNSKRPDIIVYSVATNGEQVINGDRIGPQMGGVHNVLLVPLGHRFAAAVWTGGQPGSVGVSILTENGSRMAQWQMPADSRSISAVRIGNRELAVLFAEWDKIKLVLCVWEPDTNALTIRGQPLVLSSNAVPHTPLCLKMIGGALLSAWFDEVVENGKTRHDECEPVLVAVNVQGVPETIARRTGSKLPLPSWGPPRGILAIEESTDERSKGIGLSWSDMADEASAGIRQLLPVAPIALEQPQ